MKASLHKRYLLEDPKGETCFLLTKLLKLIYYSITTFTQKIKMHFWGIEVGKNVKICGNILVSRFQNSTIKIGMNCKFISSSMSNFRGINHRCIIHTGDEGAVIEIGDNCGFSGVSIVANKLIKISNNVMVGANTIIGDRDDHPDRLHTEPSPIIIDEGVFIGMNCIVMKGVHIGANSIIGAGSIVTKDIPENVVAVGNPCKVVKEINKKYEK